MIPGVSGPSGTRCSEIPDPTIMSASTSLESEDGRERRNSLGLSLGPSTPPLFTPQPRRSSPVPRSMSRGSRPSSPARGRSRSPITTPLGHSPPASPRHLPSYAHSALDRAPSPSPELMIPRPKVPPPIYLRSSSPQGTSSSGQLKIHIPAWGVVFVKPPQELDLHPLEDGSQAREPPTEDTVLSGSLEVIMKERRRCQAISVGVQSVCRLYMGAVRKWEEDGVFERGVEVLGGDADGIWLEKGSQTFTFTLLLPATLATHDHHEFARISYILTARVEGVGATSHFGNIFRRESVSTIVPSPDIPYKEDFDAVIARSDKLAQEQATSKRSSPQRSRGSSFSAGTPPRASPRSIPKAISPPTPFSADSSSSPSPPTPGESSVIALGESSPALTGLYHRSQSAEIQRTTSHADTRSILSVTSNSSDSGQRSEKQGWLKGDLHASRGLAVHANAGSASGVSTLDIRKEGFVDGLGSWRFTLSSDSYSISAVLILSISFPSPGPATTIFFIRLLLSQSYTVTSPRTPNEPPFTPEGTKNIVLYQTGRPHKSGEKFPDYDKEALWRGPKAKRPGDTSPGTGSSEIPCTGGIPPGTIAHGDEVNGWRARAVARMPNHDRIRPSTHNGTITPIRVKHELILQIFYSVDRETVAGYPCDGPGELRMMSYKMPTSVPSCTCIVGALNLPTYTSADPASPSEIDIDAYLSSPLSAKKCMCGSSFAELGEAAMRKMQAQEQEDLNNQMSGLGMDGMAGGASAGAGPGGGGGGVAMSREGSMKEEDERRSIARTRDSSQRRGSRGAQG